MKRLIYLIAILPLIANAQPNTMLGSLPAGNVAVNYTSYPRGYLYPVFSISGGDTLMQINYNNYKVNVTPRNHTHYLQGDVTGNPIFPSMDSVIKWMNINFLLNAGVQINNIYDSLAASKQALADSCDTLRALIATGGSSDLQTVTNAGNYTTNAIFIYNGSTSGEYDSVQSEYIKTIGMSSSVRHVQYDYFTANRNDTLPDESGQFMMTKDSSIYSSKYFVTSSINDTIAKVVKYTDSTIKYVTPTQMGVAIHDSLPNLSGYFPTADTTYLFRKADSNTKGHAATFNLVADTAAVLRGLIPSGTMVNSVTATAPVTVSASTGTVNIGMPQSSTSTNGWLSSTDWNTFNGKGSGTVTNVGSGFGTNFTAITTTGSVVVDSTVMATKAALRKTEDSLNATIATKGSGTVTSVATSTGIIGGTITSTGTLQIDSAVIPKWDDTLASNRWLVTPYYLSTNGYGTGTVTSVGLVAGTGVTVSGSSPITTAGTYTVSLSGTMVNSVTATAPVTVSAATGTVNIGIPQATGSVDGYLSSTDWTTFNSKGSGTVTSVAGGRGITGGTITSTGTHGLDTTQAYTWLAPETISQTGLASTPADALVITNTTSATAGTTLQYSPDIHWHGAAWNTTSTASQSIDFRAHVVPVSSTTVAGNWQLQASLNGGSYATVLTVSSVGTVTIPAQLSVTSTVTLSGNLNSNATTTMGGKVNVTTGSNKAANTATLSSGTVTVSNSSVTASSLIWVQYLSGGTLSGATLTRGIRVSTITAGTSFVIVAETAPGTTNTSDNSTVQYWIIN